LRIYDVEPLLPAFGTVGLILIVFEGGLELAYERAKRPLIRKAFNSALILLLLTTVAIAFLLQAFTEGSFHACLANAVPLSVMSSTVAIPSAASLGQADREFVIYESSFSDILGIVLFNFIISNDAFDGAAFGMLGGELIAMVVLSGAFCLALLWLLGRIKHKVKFFLILAILVLVYVVGKQFHLSSLLVVLAFGIFLANADQFGFAWFRKHFLYKSFLKDIEQFHSLARESAFLIRTFFFVMFGYIVVPVELLQRELLIGGSALLGITYVVRALYLKGVLRMKLGPLVYMTPRGLITILLFLSLPPALQLPGMGLGTLFIMVLATCLIMAVGLLLTGHDPQPVDAKEEEGL
jgi:hypothetical protein